MAAANIRRILPFSNIVPARTLIALVLVLALVLALSTGSRAQSTFEGQVAAWDRVASRAEDVLQQAQASSQALEILRLEVAEQRAEAQAIVERGSVSVRSLRAQMATLGPAPADSETEAEAIAAQRSALRDKIAAANAPVLAAQQAYERAEVIIKEIDILVRSGIYEELLNRVPSPLFPGNWVLAVQEMGSYFGVLGREAQQGLSRADRSARFFGQLPAALTLGAAGLLVLLVFFPFVQRRLDRHLLRATKTSRLVGGLARTIRLVVPLIGGELLAIAILVLQLDSFGARNLLVLLPVLPILIVLAYWLSHLVFAPNLPKFRLVAMGDDQARRGFWWATALGPVLAIESVVESVQTDFAFSDGASSVLSSLVVLGGAAILWQLAAVLLQGNAESEDRPSAEGDVNFSALVARLLQVISLVATVCVLLGYVQLSKQFFIPAILSLGLIAFGMTLHRTLVSGPGSLLGTRLHNDQLTTLLPILVAMVLAIASLPLLALIWGARVADLSEFWILITQGVDIGGIRLSLNGVVLLIIVFGIGLVITQWLQLVFRTSVLSKTQIDAGARNAVVTGVGYCGITISAVAAIAAAGLDLSNLAIVAGALSVGIGFGLQAIVSNFVSGIILLIERPVKQGDWIEVSGYSGIVRKIAVRSTRIETFDRHDVIVPNSDLITGTVKNMTLSSNVGRVILQIGVAYGSEVEAVKTVLESAAHAHKLVMSYPEPLVLFKDLGASSLDFELRCFISDVSSTLNVRSDLLFDIYAKLSEAGIEIPFPRQDITIRNVGELKNTIALAQSNQTDE
ncbi:DUF3772 domain-containing protein [Devosia rhodophyticola]|uniref:DUF3772 domain-containing protein n=1 Tax=Devosia rhodophyticola TaxID=3026423 RepID=A0ABY7YXB5_9HYPH|nr:DUF3772 domain-containing protein [Devosia rhodophyticola]WDR05999.1 DUF3772 domain-containing protein [Devosia rhodophyticola]